MRIGTVKEIKRYEYRVGLTPSNVREYVNHGHEVFVQKGAGAGSSFSSEEYAAAGATVLNTAKEVWDTCDMIVKVKEPLPDEYPLMREGQIIYTYLHLAASQELTLAMLEKKVTGIAYETIEDATGALPLLRPMSEIAGKLSIQAGARCLEKPVGGRGILLGGAVGVKKAECVILGAGVVGVSALKMAVGLGANVTVLDKNMDRLAYLDDVFGSRIQTLYSSPTTISDVLPRADLVIGAVLIPGGKAPKLILKEHLKTMKPGAVIVDVAVDQGGCAETTAPTYHDAPTFVVDGIVHYCVGNMPGAVSQTSTFALTNATLAYGLKIANLGIEAAAAQDAGLKLGVNCIDGKLTCKGVAEAFGMEHTDY